MSKVVRVRCEGDVLKPLKLVELREGEEVIVGIGKGVREAEGSHWCSWRV